MISVLAWRNIWRHKSRSLIIIGSIALGMLAGIFILALYEGMIESRIRTVIEDEVSHLQIHHPDFKKDYDAKYIIPDARMIISQLTEIKDIDHTSGRVITQGMLATANGSSGVEIRGVDPDAEDRTSRLSEKIIAGNYLLGKGKHEVLVGKKLMQKKGLKLNTKVVLTFSDKDNNITSGAFRIVGIYESTNTALDERIIYTSRESLSGSLNVGEDLHEIAIILANDAVLPDIQQLLQKNYPDLEIKSWYEITPETELLVTVFDQYSFIILVIIMLTLAFGIINTMLMAILERTKETGMMIALGMTKIRLSWMVLLETIILTVLGSPIGIGLAWIITAYFSQKGIDTTAFAESLMGDFGFEKIVYPIFPHDQLSKIIILVTSTAIISSIVPILKAIRMEPADALRK